MHYVGKLPNQLSIISNCSLRMMKVANTLIFSVAGEYAVTSGAFQSLVTYAINTYVLWLTIQYVYLNGLLL